MTKNNTRYPVYKWLRAHQEDTVEMEILTWCTSDAELLSNLEVFWIRHLRDRGHRLLNCTDGGEGVVNLSPEARRKMSEAARLRVGPRSSMFGRVYTPEERKKMSDQQKGKPSLGAHNRWHVNRGVRMENCVLCVGLDT